MDYASRKSKFRKVASEIEFYLKHGKLLIVDIAGFLTFLYIIYRYLSKN